MAFFWRVSSTFVWVVSLTWHWYRLCSLQTDLCCAFPWSWWGAWPWFWGAYRKLWLKRTFGLCNIMAPTFFYNADQYIYTVYIYTHVFVALRGPLCRSRPQRAYLHDQSPSWCLEPVRSRLGSMERQSWTINKLHLAYLHAGKRGWISWSCFFLIGIGFFQPVIWVICCNHSHSSYAIGIFSPDILDTLGTLFSASLPCCRGTSGTDVDYGALTKAKITAFQELGGMAVVSTTQTPVEHIEMMFWLNKMKYVFVVWWYRLDTFGRLSEFNTCRTCRKVLSP